MTIVDVHAICILALPAAIIGLLWFAPKDQHLIGMRIGLAAAAAVLWFLVLLLTTALTPWYPIFQWAIPGSCMVAIALFVSNWRVAATAAVISGLVGIGLIFWAWSFDERNDHVRRNYRRRFSESIDRSIRRGVELEMKELTRKLNPSEDHPGWAEILYPSIRQDIQFQYLSEPSFKYGPQWHTWLTGLLEPVGTEYLGIWCTDTDKFEVRERVYTSK